MIEHTRTEHRSEESSPVDALDEMLAEFRDAHPDKTIRNIDMDHGAPGMGWTAVIETTSEGTR